MKTKRVSKKLKSSWRKHIDDTDVDSFFENKRLEERLGKPFELRNDSEIFQIDTRPGPLLRESISSPKLEEGKSPLLRCFQGLENSSAVLDPLVKRNTIRSKEQRQHPTLKKKNEIRLKKGILKKKEIVQLQKYFHKRVSCLEQKRRRRITVKDDIWAEKSDEPSKLLRLENWFDERTLLHTVRNTSDLKEKTNYRPQAAATVIPSFECPHPGISYNPSFKDHLDIAIEATDLEKKAEKEEKHLNRVTQNMFQQISAEKNEKNWIKEMSEGLPQSGTTIDFAKDIDSDDSEYQAINPAVTRDKKKTIKQKKKQLRLKQEEQKRKEAKEQKKKSLDICKIKYLMDEIKDEELKKEKKSLKRLQKSAKKFEVPRRVGKNKFTMDEPTVADISELTGSLREIVPQGNVMRDELKSLQKRNLIEVTKPQFKNKKKKMKKYALKSHRTERLEFSAKELMKTINRSDRKRLL